MKDVFKELKVLGRKVTLPKLTTNVLETIFTNTSTILALFTIITGGQYLNEIREPRFRRSPPFYGRLVFPHT